MEAKVIIEVIKRLTGAVNPVGKSEVDKIRTHNLDTLCKVTDGLIDIIHGVYKQNENSTEASVKALSDQAKTFLEDIGHLERHDLD